MDFFGGIRNFIGGLFGNNDEEERRRRQQQQSRPSTVTSRPLDRSEINFGPSIRTPQPFEIPGRERDEPAPSPLLNLGGVQNSTNRVIKPADPNPNNRTPEQLRELARIERDHQARMDKIKSDQIWGNIWEVPKATGTVGKAIAQGTARIPETVARTIAQPLGDAIGVNTSQQRENTGIRKFLYGEDPVQTYHDQARDIGQWARESDNEVLNRLAPVSPLIAPLLASLDIGTGGLTTKGVTAAGSAVRRSIQSNPVARAIDDTVASGTPPVRVADDLGGELVRRTPPTNNTPRELLL